MHGWSRRCNFVSVQPNQVYLCSMQIPMEIYRFITFFTPWFTVPEHEEIISISPLDELLLMGNYPNTKDGTLVNNSAAAVHNMRDTGEGRKEWENMNLSMHHQSQKVCNFLHLMRACELTTIQDTAGLDMELQKRRKHGKVNSSSVRLFQLGLNFQISGLCGIRLTSKTFKYSISISWTGRFRFPEVLKVLFYTYADVKSLESWDWVWIEVKL